MLHHPEPRHRAIAAHQFLDAGEVRRLGEHSALSLNRLRSPTMPDGVAYALLPRVGYGVKPAVFASLAALARRIHRERGHEALELRPERLTFRDSPREVTAVYARHPVSDRLRFIGYAWHAGRDWRALEAALQATVPAGLVEG